MAEWPWEARATASPRTAAECPAPERYMDRAIPEILVTITVITVTVLITPLLSVFSILYPYPCYGYPVEIWYGGVLSDWSDSSNSYPEQSYPAYVNPPLTIRARCWPAAGDQSAE
jgi:hypothetical protein